MMRRTLFFTTALLLLLSTLAASGQALRDEIAADPTKACGVYRLYPDTFAEGTPVPDGYEPFYISHYGRHGSRYILRNRKFDSVLKEFRDASAAGELTPLGKDVLGRLERAAVVCEGRAGELTPLGQRQHRAIARRMYASYPEIFGHNPRITAVSTVSPRVIMSMAAFTSELWRCDAGLDITLDTGTPYMPYLNPYTPYNIDWVVKKIDAQRYPVGEWVEGWRDFVRRNVPVGRLMGSLFVGERAERLAGDADFAMSLYKCAASLPGTPSGERLWDIFTTDELYGLWRANNMVFYYEKGPSGIDGGFLDEAAAPLLKDFVDDAAERVAAGNPAVTLRFGHDGVIMGLLNCMNVRGWCEKAASMEEIEVLWHDFDIPMASNLQWIFYRNAEGDVLVKMLLNEREIEFPLESETKPYYRWSDVESLYRGIVAGSFYGFGRGGGAEAK